MSEFSPELYQQQLQQKYLKTRGEFAPYGVKAVDVYESAWQHYRMRAEFKAWHQNDQVSYAMFGGDKNRDVYQLDYYPPGSEHMQKLMPQLRAALNADESLRRKLFQIEFLTTSTGEALATLIYHRPLDDDWEARATHLAQQLGIHIIGRSRKQKRVVGQDYVLEKFQVQNKDFVYQQLEGSFTQPNAGVCHHMLNWAAEHSRNWGGDLLELYCGNGNFTLPLAQNFRKVLATEVAKPGIESALFNCRLNETENIKLVRMSSEDMAGAFNRVRTYERLKHIDLADYDFSTVFVDPPRSGLDKATCEFIQAFPQIIYISCNPESLHENLAVLSQTHDLTRVALFDQFPYTDHRECGVMLRKKSR